LPRLFHIFLSEGHLALLLAEVKEFAIVSVDICWPHTLTVMGTAGDGHYTKGWPTHQLSPEGPLQFPSLYLVVG
jgi:hypothetical protein